MADRVSQAEINDIAWRACDTFRGTLDPAQYKDFILVMLFIKYMSDLWKDKREQYEARYHGDAQRVEVAIARERCVIQPEADFDSLYAKRRETNIGHLIIIAFD